MAKKTKQPVPIDEPASELELVKDQLLAKAKKENKKRFAASADKLRMKKCMIPPVALRSDW